ncbi:MAG: hypothetical protein ACRCVT_11350 [Leadbetterella sp.]
MNSYVDIDGGEPYKILLNDGQRDLEVNGFSTLFLAQTTTITFKQISKQCGVINTNQKVDFPRYA